MSKSEEIAERQAKAKELREEGKTQGEIAEELGVSAKTVQRDSDRNTVITEKVSSTRKVIGYRITQYTKPETAARRIREVFGDKFAAMCRVDLPGKVSPRGRCHVDS